MPSAHDRLAEAEAHLRALCEAVGLALGPGELRLLSPARAALLDFLDANPYCTIRELRVLAGDPVVGDHELSPAVTRKFQFSRGRPGPSA